MPKALRTQALTALTKSTIRKIKQSLFNTRKPLLYLINLDGPKANMLLITEKADFCNLHTVEPCDYFFSEKFYIILKSSETRSYKSKSSHLITLLLGNLSKTTWRIFSAKRGMVTPILLSFFGQNDFL